MGEIKMDLTPLAEALAAGRLPKIKPLVSEALAAGVPAKEILENGLLAGMKVVGDKFKAGKMYVPEVMLAARCMQTGADMIKPQLQKEEAESGKSASGTVIIGTVKGDRHDIGKNLCRLMLEGRGLNVIDLGVDVPAEKFVAEAQKHNAKVIGCSALLTTTMPEMGRVVEKVKEAGGSTLRFSSAARRSATSSRRRSGLPIRRTPLHVLTRLLKYYRLKIHK